MTKILPCDTDLYALTDSRLGPGRTAEEQALEYLKNGIRILQYREKKLSRRKMLEECLALRKLADQFDACLIINDHIELAMLAKADGLHIGQDDLPPAEARKLLGPNFIIGLSTHSIEQAKAAMQEPVDYIGAGPVYATKTKEDVCAPVGLSYIDWVARNISLPFAAIGGIKAHNIADVCKHGAKCCALVSELAEASDIGAKISELRSQMAKA